MCTRGKAGGLPGQHATQVVPGHGRTRNVWGGGRGVRQVHKIVDYCLQSTYKIIFKSTSTNKGVHLQQKHLNLKYNKLHYPS